MICSHRIVTENEEQKIETNVNLTDDGHLSDVSGAEQIENDNESNIESDALLSDHDRRSLTPSLDSESGSNRYESQRIAQTPIPSAQPTNSTDAHQLDPNGSNPTTSPIRSNFHSPTRSRSNTESFDLHTNSPNISRSRSRSEEIEHLQQNIVNPNAPSDDETCAQITGLHNIDRNEAHVSDDDVMNDFETSLEPQQQPQDNGSDEQGNYLPNLSVDDEHKSEIEEQTINNNQSRSAYRSSQSRARSVRSSSNVQNPGDRNHCVLSLIEYRNRKEIGAAVIDLTAPKIDLYQFTDKASYSDSIALITSLHPSTILFPSTSSKGLVAALKGNENLRQMDVDNYIRQRPISRKYFNDSEGIRVLTEICTKDSLKQVAINDNSMWLALSACNAAICWLNHGGPRFAAHTVTLSYRSIDGYMKLDFETIKNLELVSNLKHPRSKNGTLLKALDFCQTKMGKRLLRSSLYQPLCKHDAIVKRLDVVELILQNNALYGNLVQILAEFHDLDSINNALSRVPKSDPNKINAQTAMKFIVSVVGLEHNLQCLPNLVFILSQYKEESALLKEWAEQFEDEEYSEILHRIEQTIDDQHNFNPKASIYRQQSAIIETIKTGICGELDTAKHLYFDMERTLNERVEAYKQNFVGMKLHFTASRGYHVCIPLVHRERVEANPLFIEQHIKKKNIYCTTSQILLLNQSLAETHKNIMRLSQRVLNELLLSMQKHMTSLHILSEYLAKLDMLTSFATYCHSISTEYVRPQLVVNESGPINFKNGKHPILERLSRHKIVANNVSIYETRNLQIINGPNASGKSTYIKQAALLCIMAHIGCFVPASYASLKLIDQIFSRLSNGDKLQMNQSSFLNECKDLNYILSSLKAKTALVIIDELGRSTSSIDAYSFAWSCCEFLKRHKNVFTLFVTHFDMDRLAMYPNVICNKFRMKAENNKISYSYKLYSSHHEFEQYEDGYVRQERPYGIMMAEMTGFPSAVIEEAKDVLTKIRQMNVSSTLVQESVPLSEYENAVISREHTETIRGTNNLTKEQIIDVLMALEAQITQNIDSNC